MSMVPTGDGSFTLYSEAAAEHYHSTKDGAYNEALHKHVYPAWEYRIRQREHARILDLGFGIGYNTLALLQLLEEKNYGGRVEILALEKDIGLLASLPGFPYPAVLARLRPLLADLIARGVCEESRCRLELVTVEARDWLRKFKGPVDVIFHDPFSPLKNPTLWTRECFAEYRRIGAPDLLVTTYSTASAVRFGLYENGFRIYENRPAALVRSSTLATPGMLPLPEIDMELKRIRNPAAASLRDPAPLL